MVAYISAEEAVKIVESGNRVFLHGSAATPVSLVNALLSRHAELRSVELVSITNMGDIHFDAPECAGAFFFNSLFVSTNTRKVVNSNHGAYMHVLLSQIHELFRKGILPLNVALVQFSPPDEHGYCSLGPSVYIEKAAVETDSHIIAHVYPRMPRTHGD